MPFRRCGEDASILSTMAGKRSASSANDPDPNGPRPRAASGPGKASPVTGKEVAVDLASSGDLWESGRQVAFPGPTASLSPKKRPIAAPTEATMNDAPIERNPDILGGTPVFARTRVPVRILMEYLEAGDRLDDFLQDFPSVSRDQAVAVLERARMILAGEQDEAAA